MANANDKNVAHVAGDSVSAGNSASSSRSSQDDQLSSSDSSCNISNNHAGLFVAKSWDNDDGITSDEEELLQTTNNLFENSDSQHVEGLSSEDDCDGLKQVNDPSLLEPAPKSNAKSSTPRCKLGACISSINKTQDESSSGESPFNCKRRRPFTKSKLDSPTDSSPELPKSKSQLPTSKDSDSENDELLQSILDRAETTREQTAALRTRQQEELDRILAELDCEQRISSDKIEGSLETYMKDSLDPSLSPPDKDKICEKSSLDTRKPSLVLVNPYSKTNSRPLNLTIQKDPKVHTEDVQKSNSKTQNPYSKKTAKLILEKAAHPLIQPRPSNSFEAPATVDTSKNEVELASVNVSKIGEPDIKITLDPPIPLAPVKILNFGLSNRPIHARQRLAIDSVVNPRFSIWSYKCFNTMQSEMLNTLLRTTNNACISAPTGAGKTCLFEMAVIHVIQQNKKNTLSSNKIVYIAPNKALCEERLSDWSKRLNALNLGLVCTAVTGDHETTLSTFQTIKNSNMIITTPEKWDSLTRRWNENLNFLLQIRLLLLDEVHLLGDPERGCCLETVICRMKIVHRVANRNKSSMRIVAVSATLPNCQDIAAFLECPAVHVFDASYRPVPLTTHVIGCGCNVRNQYLFDRGLNGRVPSLMEAYSDGKPSIVFCHTKKDTEVLAVELATKHALGVSASEVQVLDNFAKRANTSVLQTCLRRGAAFHNAGLDPEDKQLVEEAFASGVVKVLCATSTLAMGVNLPAHLVIVKGTTTWRGTLQRYQPIDTGTLLQMMGRAGRPGFDTRGVSVIMTDNSSKASYEQVARGAVKPVESQLLRKLTESLNTEISQGVILNATQSVWWVQSSFLFKRLSSSPQSYGIKLDGVDDYLMTQCKAAISKLVKHEIIRFSSDRLTISPNTASHVMSQHMVDFDSMTLFMALPQDASEAEILVVLSKCKTLQFPLRRSEKTQLNEVHKVIKYKIDPKVKKFRIQTTDQKTFVLLQVSIGQHYLEDFTLRQEMSQIVDNAQRMLQAIEDYSVKGSKNGAVALASLLLRRSLATSLWGANDGVLNQLRGVGSKTTKKLSEAGILTFLDVMSSHKQAIERAAGRLHPFGSEIRSAVSKIFRSSLSLSMCMEEHEEDQTDDSTTIICKVDKCNLENVPCLEEANATEPDASERIVIYTLVIHTDQKGGLLKFKRSITGPDEYRVSCPKDASTVFVRLVSNLVGLDNHLTIQCEESVIDKDNESQEKKLETPFTKAKGAGGLITEKRKQDPTAQIKAREEMVSHVADLRIKKGSNQKDNVCSQVPKPPTKVPAVTPSPHMRENSQRSNFTLEKGSANNQSLILNSSHSNTGSSWQEKATGINMISAGQNQGLRTDITPNFTNNSQTTLQPERKRPRSFPRSNWKEQKREQLSLQAGAYGTSPKNTNPFSAFKYDPNNIESNLDSISAQYNEQITKQSIIPRDAILAGIKVGLSCSIGRGQFNSNAFCSRSRRKSNAHKLDSRQLLGLKVAEQNAYRDQITPPPQTIHEQSQHVTPFSREIGASFQVQKGIPLVSRTRPGIRIYDQRIPQQTEHQVLYRPQTCSHPIMHIQNSSRMCQPRAAVGQSYMPTQSQVSCYPKDVHYHHSLRNFPQQKEEPSLVDIQRNYQLPNSFYEHKQRENYSDGSNFYQEELPVIACRTSMHQPLDMHQDISYLHHANRPDLHSNDIRYSVGIPIAETRHFDSYIQPTHLSADQNTPHQQPGYRKHIVTANRDLSQFSAQPSSLEQVQEPMFQPQTQNLNADHSQFSVDRIRESCNNAPVFSQHTQFHPEWSMFPENNRNDYATENHARYQLSQFDSCDMNATQGRYNTHTEVQTGQHQQEMGLDEYEKQFSAIEAEHSEANQLVENLLDEAFF